MNSLPQQIPEEYALAIDCGGTRTKFAYRKRQSNDLIVMDPVMTKTLFSRKNKEQAVDALIDHVFNNLPFSNQSNIMITKISVSWAGPVHASRGILLQNGPELHESWKNFDLADAIKKRIMKRYDSKEISERIQVYVTNDAVPSALSLVRHVFYSENFEDQSVLNEIVNSALLSASIMGNERGCISIALGTGIAISIVLPGPPPKIILPELWPASKISIDGKLVPLAWTIGKGFVKDIMEDESKLTLRLRDQILPALFDLYNKDFQHQPVAIIILGGYARNVISLHGSKIIQTNVIVIGDDQLQQSVQLEGCLSIGVPGLSYELERIHFCRSTDGTYTSTHFRWN